MLGSVLTTRANAHSGLSTLIGTRFAPGQLTDDEAVPAVTYQVISTPERDDVPEMYDTRVQFDCWAGTYPAAKGVAEQVKAAFVGWTAKSGTPKVLFGKRANEIDVYEPVTARWRIIVDLQFLTVE